MRAPRTVSFLAAGALAVAPLAAACSSSSSSAPTTSSTTSSTGYPPGSRPPVTVIPRSVDELAAEADEVCARVASALDTFGEYHPTTPGDVSGVTEMLSSDADQLQGVLEQLKQSQPDKSQQIEQLEQTMRDIEDKVQQAVDQAFEGNFGSAGDRLAEAGDLVGTLHEQAANLDLTQCAGSGATTTVPVTTSSP